VQAFKTADKRRTGTIPIKSLRDVLETIQKSALTNQQFYVITADADVENSGVLEIGEFLQVRSLPSSCNPPAIAFPHVMVPGCTASSQNSPTLYYLCQSYCLAFNRGRQFCTELNLNWFASPSLFLPFLTLNCHMVRLSWLRYRSTQFPKPCRQ
jgi:hypothetical protein